MSNEPIIEIVGSSEIWFRLNEMSGRCQQCDGDGVLATTDRAAYYPEKYPEELVSCHECDGTSRSRKELRQTS